MSKPQSIPFESSSVARISFFCWILLLGLISGCSSPGDGSSLGAGGTQEEQPTHETHAEGEKESEEHDEHEENFVQLSPEALARADIQITSVIERVLQGEIKTTGHVDFDESRLAHVSPRITGRVHRVRARLGQQVSVGETLAEIDSIELGRSKAEFLQAKAREELARTTYERERKLFEEQIFSERTMLTAEAEWRETEANLGTAKETLRLYGLDEQAVAGLNYGDPKASIYPLKAPFAGTITERHATLGELVTPERNLFTLADLGRVWIWIDISQRDLGRVHLGDEARARVDAYADDVFIGKVSYFSAEVDTDTRTVRARLDIVNPAGKLRPGMFVNVELFDPHQEQGQGNRDASRVVPEEAVARDGERSVVFVAVGTGRFERREVLAGRRAGGYIEILSGLDAGAEVVVKGTFLLQSAAAKESMGAGHSH